MKTQKAVLVLRSAILLFLIFIFCKLDAQVQTAKYVSMTPMSKGYYEYLPQGYSSGSTKYPLIIFVTGIGELGDGSAGQLPKVLNNGTPKQINQGIFPASFNVNGQSYSFIVLSPQFTDWPGYGEIDNIIDYAIQHYRVDVSRIYLTGLSMGGGVVWEYVGNNSTYANRIAAIVPIAGASYPDVGRSQIIAAADVAVWATHNDNDPTVATSNTIGYINNINSAPNPPTPLAKMTIFQSGSHDAWTKTYDLNFRENGLNVYEWMLQYQRGASTPIDDDQPPVANAGSNISITLPANSVQLNGSDSYDDGTLNYNWTKISGPAQFSLSNSSIVNPLCTNLVAGTYVFRLIVTDDQGAANTDDVTVTVNSASTLPTSGKVIPGRIEAESYDNKYYLKTESTSDAGGGLNVGGLGTGSWMDYNVNVATTGIYTANFRIATPYAGTQLQLKKSDGTVLSTVTLPQTPAWQSYATVSTSVALTAGNQTLRVYVSIASFNFNWFEFIGTSSPSNQLPVADAGGDKTITLPTNSVTLAGSGTDADGTIASYEWTEVSGPNVSGISSPAGAHSTMTKLIQGTYVFQLKVTDNKGAIVTDRMQLTVLPEGQQPGGVTKYVMVNVYGGSNPYNNSAWNNWNVGTGTSSNITSGLFRYSDGTSSGINSVLSNSQTVGDNASSYGSGMAPMEVLRYTSYSQQARSLTVSGLSTSTKYNIELYASRWSTGNSTIFTVNGSSVTITTYRNYTNKASFTNITPNSQGQIIVNIKSANSYNYLNGFMITQQGTDAARPELVTEVNDSKNLRAAVATLGEDDGTSVRSKKLSPSSISSVEVFPNPVTDQVVMQLSNLQPGIIKIQVLNAGGAVKKQLSLKHSSSISKITIPVSELPAGTYIIRVQAGNWSAAKKIIKS